MKNIEADEITLGDLIVAFTEEAIASVHNEKEIGRVVANILTDVLHDAEPISRCWH